jgi:hypothetical protein
VPLRKHTPDVGRHHAGSGAQEQRGTDLLLHHLDASRQRRLAQVQHRGRAGEASELRQRKNVTHLSDLQSHAFSICQR